MGNAEIASWARMTSAGKREMEINAFEQVVLVTLCFTAHRVQGV